MRSLSSIPIERDSLDLGEIAQTQEEAAEFENRGWRKCENPMCFFFASPEGQQWISDYQRDEYKCPNCNALQKLIVGWDMDDDQKTARCGLSLSDLGKLGELSIYYAASKEPEWLNRYGQIIWWQSGITSLVSGGALDAGKLDGISRGPDGTIWGIEVKAADVENRDPGFNIDNIQRDEKHHYAANFARYEPDLSARLGIMGKPNVSRPKREFTPSQKKKMQNVRGFNPDPSGKLVQHEYDRGNNDIDALLAVLPVFDFKNSEVDIYVKETPLSGHPNAQKPDVMNYGIVKFRPKSGTLLLDKIPFANPYMNPLLNEFPTVCARQVFDKSPPTDDELMFKAPQETAIGNDDEFGARFDPTGLGRGFEEDPF